MRSHVMIVLRGLTNIDFVAFIPTWRHACAKNCRSRLGLLVWEHLE